MNTKKKNYVKLLLDIAMGVTFALLFNKRVFGTLAFHEIAGIAIGGAVVAHILLNYRFVQKITMRLFDKSLPGRTRLSYALNVLLLLCMSFVIVSGLLISKVVLPNFRFGNEGYFKVTHMGVSYLTLVLIGVHIGLHWHWVMNMFQKLLRLRMPKRAAQVVMVTLAVAVLGYGSYQVYSNQFLSKLQMVKNVVQYNSPAKGGHEGGEDHGQAPAGGQRTAGKPGADMRGGKMGGGTGGGMASPNPVSVMMTYFGIMAVFAGITYYLDKWLSIRRKRVRAGATAAAAASS